MQEIKKIIIQDENYPKLLKEIPDPAKTLYIRGKIPNGPCFAIVGTRLCSPYGKQVALEISYDLTQASLVIVSGMACGIDTTAHKGCLEAGGKTIAVLGTGLDDKSIYPQENLKLAHQIIESGGCLISELAPGTPGYPSNFSQRNRIISGLSLGVLVVEAKQKSGALITANLAKKQGKKVFAIPGPIHSQNSKGPHSLIKNGAILVENASDIIKELTISKQIKLGKCSIFQIEQKAKGQEPEENLILDALKEQPLHIEKIIEKTNLPAQKVCSILSLMEIKEKVRNLGGNIFAVSR